MAGFNDLDDTDEGPMTGAGTRPVQREQVGPALLGKRKAGKAKKKEEKKPAHGGNGAALLGMRRP